MRARIEGTVQGVGFRPFVYRLASELALGGRVLNDERGVVLEVEGEGGAVERFLERLPLEAPPLASVERVLSDDVAPVGETSFRIVESESHGVAAAPVAPDTAPCLDCLRELLDPRDRRHRYPFINCTNCGPALRLTDADGERLPGDPLDEAVVALVAGEVVAVKGLGGFHLACRADDEAAVGALRVRKHREDKPFALMCHDLEAARGLATLSADDERLLHSRERPIVLAPRRPEAVVAGAVAPRSADLGVMLPYTPLHHLLLAACGTTLVMTSGNVSDEPIAYAEDDALGRLGGIADRFLLHDRPIQVRTDDSVVRATRTRPLVLRRSRGYVPASLPLPDAHRPILACGAELKSTFCVAKGGRAWVGHHIGDLKNYETLRSFSEGIDHFERLFEVTPEVIAHDLHPDYLSTAYALGREDVSYVPVQHHHAHLASVLAEHGHEGRAVGAILDGAGLGDDRSVWGGEVLVGDAAGFERAGHLWPVRLPGGDRAAEEPWRMACAWLAAASEEAPPLPGALAPEVEERDWAMVADMARTGLASPVTTSAGRLFDAVAALCGVRARVNYEGQAAAELEALARADERGAYPLPVGEDLVLDPRGLVLAVAHECEAGVPAATVSARFHNSLASAVASGCLTCADGHSLDTVVLSGGVFQNRLLLGLTRAAVEEAGLRVLVPERLPPNDGAISYGQAAIAAYQMQLQ